MENEKIVLKPKNKNTFFYKMDRSLRNKSKRRVYLLAFVAPFIIAIGIFGFVAFKEAKNLIGLIKGNEVKKENIVETMNYVLRDNATDIQKEYFAELKTAAESLEGYSKEEIAGLVCKNYVADLYTWSNKQGQYDISALYYVYTPNKTLIYTQLRDGFYKYLNNYISDYKSENLLEVESVQVLSSKKTDYTYLVNEELYDEAFEVECSWTYVSKPESYFNTSKYAKRMCFLVVERAGRFEIVEANTRFENIRPEVEMEEVEDAE